MTSTDDPRTERIKIFLIAVDPQQRYSSETEKGDLTKTFMVFTKILLRCKCQFSFNLA